jgi:hypothetical protein
MTRRDLNYKMTQRTVDQLARLRIAKMLFSAHLPPKVVRNGQLIEEKQKRSSKKLTPVLIYRFQCNQA